MQKTIARELEFILIGEEKENPVARVVNSRESPLDTLLRRGRIDEIQFQAGLFFRRDFEQGGLVGVKGFDISRERVDGGRGAGNSDFQLNRRERLHKAMTGLGRRSLGLVVNVCALGIGLNEVEKRCALPRSSGLPLLQDGLDALAGYYALKTPEAANNNEDGA